MHDNKISGTGKICKGNRGIFVIVCGICHKNPNSEWHNLAWKNTQKLSLTHYHHFSLCLLLLYSINTHKLSFSFWNFESVTDWNFFVLMETIVHFSPSYYQTSAAFAWRWKHGGTHIALKLYCDRRHKLAKKHASQFHFHFTVLCMKKGETNFAKIESCCRGRLLHRKHTYYRRSFLIICESC